jgi:hypothetical protein
MAGLFEKPVANPWEHMRGVSLLVKRLEAAAKRDRDLGKKLAALTA